ncbi:hypothetical protein ABTL52_19830, partial [Acinetobacter baumannii]
MLVVRRAGYFLGKVHLFIQMAQLLVESINPNNRLLKFLRVDGCLEMLQRVSKSDAMRYINTGFHGLATAGHIYNLCHPT